MTKSALEFPPSIASVRESRKPMPNPKKLTLGRSVLALVGLFAAIIVLGVVGKPLPVVSPPLPGESTFSIENQSRWFTLVDVSVSAIPIDLFIRPPRSAGGSEGQVQGTDLPRMKATDIPPRLSNIVIVAAPLQAQKMPPGHRSTFDLHKAIEEVAWNSDKREEVSLLAGRVVWHITYRWGLWSSSVQQCHRLESGIGLTFWVKDHVPEGIDVGASRVRVTGRD